MKAIAAFIFISVLATSSLDLLFSLETEADSFVLDHINQIYSWEGSYLEKRNESGEFMYSFSQSDYGEIHSVDVSNPMKPLVYFKDFEHVYWLDQRLSIQTDPLDLSVKYPGSIRAVCYSVNNHMWLYHNSDQTLIRTDKRLSEIARSSPLSNWTDEQIEVVQMIEENEEVYVLTESSGILVFDLFGTFVKKIPLKRPGHIQLDNNLIQYQSENSIITYNQRNHSSSFSEYKEIENGQAIVQANRLYVLKDDELKVFSLSD